MQRIAVIGCGGSGKTTLARRLGAKLSLPVVHIDGHYWRDVDGTPVESTPEEWERTHAGLVGRHSWVIDGMKLGVLPARLAAADAVVFLDMPTRTCLAGVVRRQLRFRGRDRPELGVYDRITWDFVRWIWGFRRRQRPRILELLVRADCEVIVLRSRRDVDRFVAAVVPGRAGRLVA